MKKILLVEDEVAQSDILKSHLILAGFQVEVAASGEAGLEILKTQDFDLLIIDVLMPGMDGPAFYYEVGNKLHKKIPAIILTSVKSTAYQEDILEYIVKSEVSPDEIVAKVKHYLKVQ